MKRYSAGLEIAAELRSVPTGSQVGTETGWENMFDKLNTVC